MKPHDLEELGFGNMDFFIATYEQWKKDPKGIDPTWAKIFLAFENQVDPVIEAPKYIPSKVKQAVESGDASKVQQLLDAYRRYGHLKASISPLKSANENVPELNVGLTKEELEKECPTFGILEKPSAPLQKIQAKLESVYCGNVGVEVEGVATPEVAEWIRRKIEMHGFHPPLSIQQKQDILQHLNKAELFETFLHMRYPGQKRFSLEGCETLIPVLAALLEKGASLGADEFYLGMAHRGRLNVLCNILNKTYQDVFSEFSESYSPQDEDGGDVKYHKGYRSELSTPQGKQILLHLVDNPSHLESVYPVLLGLSRARQEKLQKVQEVIPVVIHGDAAISGQGVVYEALQFSQLEGYKTGGTIHLVLNNEIGFTTLPEEGRSTCYCTDIAKPFNCPIFHVNEEDPEAAIFAVELAVELRQTFKIDVFIDLIGYRKYGHNESDEPFFTQPLQYQIIRKKQSVREYYRDQLIQQGHLEKFMAESLEAEFKKSLNESLKTAQEKTIQTKAKKELASKQIDTHVPLLELENIALALKDFPKEFHAHPKIVQLYRERLEMVVPYDVLRPLDWGMAETLAYATLLVAGHHVRLSGQDVARGTFSHRQALLVDQENNSRYFPLNHLKEGQAKFDCYNSSLSEYAVLAFEYGYSLGYPSALTIWEAQFGDFANGAQIVMDQYISAGEQKWAVRSPLTLLLPHGYEGQGPEHSSARIERFLSLAGKNNMRIVNPTTPAQLFHLLRGQVLSEVLKPLIVFTPKGLLRHPKCVSQLNDLVQGSFLKVIDDELKLKNKKTIVFCSGRVYYDLRSMRDELAVKDLPLIRLEQLYPFPDSEVKEILDRHPNAEVLWVQEEPENMGPWWDIQQDFKRLLLPKQTLIYIGRERSATPAVGAHDVHRKEHEKMMKAVFEKSIDKGFIAGTNYEMRA